ncbi:serine/threonine-protein phosphatase 4 regulatory subunit 2 [Coccinella septempunctata]|uniref:serine/threonine-protein phosphatase 4 regulatory subunit 2 n=1 Tax=Coccinella septempunctata TaxID=41139 RepID=UPI001D095BDF|nr:serine/threonine-protein phosphatase 4 regulatory subunit 2 [Coccinella septempunctata]XP_044762194.1 serine/threonine-protein phosphatase 4 regulatory subunit 2 [Coccinella septempunctata]
MTTEDNGNIGLLKPTVSSTEDLSEYTDADESMSAPTEFLAEFLSALMMKEYGNALKYCKLILQYEPNNATAKEFYPLIIEKIKQTENLKANESNETESESEADSSSDSDSSSGDDSSDGQEDDEDVEEEEEEEVEVNMNQDKNKGSKGSSNGDNTTGSYSSLEDDEAVIDQLTALTQKYKIDNVDLGNGNKIYHSTVTDPTLSKYDYTDNKPKKDFLAVENKYNFATSSDSESPTEPVTQETIAMLRARVIPN